jgi:hypothetical protein
MISIGGIDGLENTSPEFCRRLYHVAEGLKIPAEWLAAVIAVETAHTFRADIRNPRSGFVGLIQFGPAAAARLRTHLGALAHMTNTEQLRYVAAFLAPYTGKIASVAELYLAIFAPAFMLRSSDTPVYVSPSPEYTQNAQLDSNSNGSITVAEATAPAVAVLAGASTRPAIEVSDPLPISVQTAIGTVALAAAVVAMWRATR